MNLAVRDFERNGEMGIARMGCQARKARASILVQSSLYCENAIAIDSEARDPNGCNVYYVTLQITFHIPEFARKGRNLHCDVVHITNVWVSSAFLDQAIAAIQTR